MNYKLTQEDAQNIINLYVNGESSKNLSIKYKIRKSSICKIIQGYSWKNCKRPDDIKDVAKQKFVISQFKNGFKNKFKLPNELTNIQKDIVIGSLLGDGYINKYNQFGKEQCIKFKSYIDWHSINMSEFSCKIRKRYRDVKLINKNGIITTTKVDKHLSSYIFTTHVHPIFLKLRKEWYPNDKKEIPSNLVLTPEIISIWYCDDGGHNRKGRRATLYSNGFTIDEAVFLAEKFEKFSIFPTITTIKSKYTKVLQPMINFSGNSYDEFMKLISHNLPCNCFKYKFNHRNKNEK